MDDGGWLWSRTVKQQVKSPGSGESGFGVPTMRRTRILEGYRRLLQLTSESVFLANVPHHEATTDWHSALAMAWHLASLYRAS